MDILVSSNLESVLYFISKETDLVASLMKQLNTEGFYTVPAELKAKMDEEFWAGFCGDEKAKATIAKVFKEQGYLCDTHTATGWAVAEDYVNSTGDNAPMVVLSTASPYKFPAAVLAALEDTDLTDEFMQMERLEQLTGVTIPENLKGLDKKTELHTGVIPKDKMLSFVMEL
jgi:threonine synthase